MLKTKFVAQEELRFKGPFTAPITSYLKLSNPLDKTIGFKVKTTAPKHYCVRPNSGMIKSLESIDITVLLQPFAYDPQTDYKHKFMVQFVIVPDDYDSTSLDSLFVKSSIVGDNKLRCVFELPSPPAEDIEPVTATKSALITQSAAPSSSMKDAASNLQEEISQLIKENTRLQEQVTMLSNVQYSFPSSSSNNITFGSQQKSSSNNVFVTAAILLLVLLMGILVGKMLL